MDEHLLSVMVSQQHAPIWCSSKYNHNNAKPRSSVIWNNRLYLSLKEVSSSRKCVVRKWRFVCAVCLKHSKLLSYWCTWDMHDHSSNCKRASRTCISEIECNAGITQSIFSKILTTGGTTNPWLWGWNSRCFCKFKVWFMFYICHCIPVINIMLYLVTL